MFLFFFDEEKVAVKSSMWEPIDEEEYTDLEPSWRVPKRNGKESSPRILCYLDEGGGIAHQTITEGDTSYDDYCHGKDYGYIIVYHPNILLSWDLKKVGKFIEWHRDTSLRLDQRYLD